ncbi:hypothetical protein QBZ16_003851 [Prototheca wickerhamii]|uniref:Uncharacterized protein n=1 Tax=Prototheca wickerhamii TaxID=3111 RepID=A0AAD9II52_PROWI|nr:hypothetical protein QBZ16_003851 [Prototheca wickerhamii]
MISLLGSPLVLSAATTVVKKAFEASVTTSLKGLGRTINQLYTGDVQALQDAVAVAVDILHSIDDFQNELTRWQVKRCQAQSGSSASKVREAAPSTSDVQQRLRQLIQKLDGVLPYLNLAISSLALLSPGSGPVAAGGVSPSRYAEASHILRQSAEPGAPLYSLPGHVSWHQQSRLRSDQVAQMSELAPKATLEVWRTHQPFAYEMRIVQDLDDGIFHEPDEQPLRFAFQSIAGTQGEFKPALVLRFQAPEGGAPRTFALQLRGAERQNPNFGTTEESDGSSEEPTSAEDSESGLEDDGSSGSASQSAPPTSSSSSYHDSLEALAHGTSFSVMDEWSTLGVLEYVLRLCSLESAQQDSHTALRVG